MHDGLKIQSLALIVGTSLYLAWFTFIFNGVDIAVVSSSHSVFGRYESLLGGS